MNRLLERTAEGIHAANVARGFYSDRDPERANDCLAVLMLITTEVAELAEEVRKREIPLSEKIPGFTAEEDEAADVLIRLLDYCAWRKLRLGDAMEAKLAYNATRAYKHGKRA